VIDVTVKVDEERLAEFYAMYAEWLGRPSRSDVPPDAGLVGWEPGDIFEARFVWEGLHPRARRLFEILLASGEPVPGTELAAALGPEAREDTVFGSFGPPAKLAKEVGRRHMVETTHTASGTAYWLTPTTRALLEQARADEV
jgi:Family of unknown function (DUF6416)